MVKYFIFVTVFLSIPRLKTFGFFTHPKYTSVVKLHPSSEKDALYLNFLFKNKKQGDKG
jgi:hypothetical protein